MLETGPMETTVRNFFLKLDETGMTEWLAVGKKMLQKLCKYVLHTKFQMVLFDSAHLDIYPASDHSCNSWSEWGVYF